MNEFLLSFIFWLVFWVGGWIFLRSFPLGLNLINRKLFLEVDFRFILIVDAFLFLGFLLSWFFFKHLFGELNLFKLKPSKLNLLLSSGITLLIIANLLAILFLREKGLTILFLGFIASMSYYFLVILFQQVISFGVLQEAIMEITNSSTRVIFGVAFLFSLSHFISTIEGFSGKETLIAILSSFFFGILFSFLRLRYDSLIPGFLVHFGLYLLLNGPLLYLLGI